MAKQQGFQRDVTTDISVPQVQAPDFNQNRSTVEDVADIASFGLQLFDRYQAGEKQKTAEIALKENTDQSDVIFSNYLRNVGQKGRNAANIQAHREISRTGNTGVQTSMFGERLSVFNRGAVAEKAKQGPVNSFTYQTKQEQGRIAMAAGVPDGAVPTEEGPAMTMVLNYMKTASDLSAESDLAIAEVKMAKDVTIHMANRMGSAISAQIGFQLTPVVNELVVLSKKASNLPANQAKAVYDQLLEDGASLRDTFETSIDKELAWLPVALRKEQKDELMIQLDRTITDFTDVDKVQRDKNIKTYEFLTNAIKLDMFQSGNFMEKMKLAIGKDIPELTWKYLQDNKKVGEEFMSLAANTFGLTPQQEQLMTIETFQSYVAGAGKLDDLKVGNAPITKEARARLYKDGFDFLSGRTKSGEFLTFKKENKDRIGNAMIHVLDDSNHQDSNTQKQIVKWANDDNFRALLDSPDFDQDKAKTIKNMIINSSKTASRSADGSIKFINKAPAWFRLNVGKGIFELTDAAPLANSKTLTLAMDEANRDLRAFMQSKDANDGLKDMDNSTVLHWFLKEGAGNLVLDGKVETFNGTLKPTEREERKAIDSGRSLKDIQAEVAEQTSVFTETNKLHEKIALLEKASLISPEDQEAIELVKQLRATKDPELFQKILAELKVL